jgi:hypothetical protein
MMTPSASFSGSTRLAVTAYDVFLMSTTLFSPIAMPGKRTWVSLLIRVGRPAVAGIMREARSSFSGRTW